ncbi:MAG TPA: hypothetical protein VFL14_08925, partial [Xanthomonadales bacterium]|nr:hypothetical protein [Xanthomonadales bacterium]
AAFLFLGVALPSLAHLAQRYAQRPPAGLDAYAATSVWLTGQPLDDRPRIAALRQRIVDDMQRVAATVPAGTCLHADLLPPAWLYAHRVALEPVNEREPSLARRLAVSRCPYYYVIAAYEDSPPDVAALAALGNELVFASAPLDARTGSPATFLFRVRPASP